MNFSEFFYYDEGSPSGLRWAISRFCGRHHNVLIASAGDQAGYLTDDGYWSVCCNYKRYKAHRVILELCGVECSGMQVDHINQSRLDNRIENLRVVDNKTNSRNQGKRPRNKTGVTGVSRNRKEMGNGKVYEYFTAYWRSLDGKFYQKLFPIHKLGETEAFRLACECRDSAINELNSQGAGYTEQHGT